MPGPLKFQHHAGAHQLPTLRSVALEPFPEPDRAPHPKFIEILKNDYQPLTGLCCAG